MEEIVIRVVEKMYQEKPHSVSYCGGGFYGRVFLAEKKEEPQKIILKLYLFPDLAKREWKQLQHLRKKSLLQVPKPYFLLEKEEEIPYDILGMEYILGMNAADESFSAKELPFCKQIGEQIIDNLLVWHNQVNLDGFGEIDGDYDKNWNNCYYKRVEDSIRKAEIMAEDKRISKQIWSVMRQAEKNFDYIFYLPVARASLIHGDYNTWNILLDLEKTKAIAAIDPFNCCFADAELDLYQLSNANGIEYSLLDWYRNKTELSENYEVKSAFYQLYTEVVHYFDSHVEPDIRRLEKMAERLNEKMRKYAKK